MADLNVYPVSVQYFGDMWKIINGRGQVDVISGGGGGGTQYNEGDTDASITGTAILWEDVGDTLRTVSAAFPLPVDIISGGAGGTQYTEGDTDASITGTAILWEDAGDTLRVPSAANPLPVDIISGGASGVQYTEGDIDASITGTAAMAERSGSDELRPLQVNSSDHLFVAAVQSGTWTVDIGTGGITEYTEGSSVATIVAPAVLAEGPGDTLHPLQMNGALEVMTVASQSGIWNITNISGTVSLPTGAATAANQVLEIASLSVMDDWDETDRAKVNLIVGQAGVQGASGAVSANTQRVVLATDVALPAGTNNIGDVDIISLPDEGQQTMANSISVAIASNQSAVPISGTVTADTELPAAVALADNVANPTTPIIGAYVHGKRQGGTTYDRVTNEVANSNTLGATDDRGIHAVDLTKYHRTADLTGVNTNYDTSTTETNSSQSIDCSRFRQFLLTFRLQVTLTPTDIQFIVQFSHDGGTTWFDYRDWFWGQLLYDDVAVGVSGFRRAFRGDCVGDFIRLTVTGTGLSGTNFFTVSEARFIFKN